MLLRAASVQPERWAKKHAVIGLFDLRKGLLCTLATSTRALAAETFLVPHASSEVIPELDEETSVVGAIDDATRMVEVVLERSVDEPVVGIRVFEFVAPVEVAPISIEKGCKHGEEHIDVDRGDQGKDEQRRCAHELIEPLVSN